MWERCRSPAVPSALGSGEVPTGGSGTGAAGGVSAPRGLRAERQPRCRFTKITPGRKKKKAVAIFNVYVYIFFMLCARSRRQNAVVCSRVGALWTAAFREGGENHRGALSERCPQIGAGGGGGRIAPPCENTRGPPLPSLLS